MWLCGYYLVVNSEKSTQIVVKVLKVTGPLSRLKANAHSHRLQHIQMSRRKPYPLLLVFPLNVGMTLYSLLLNTSPSPDFRLRIQRNIHNQSERPLSRSNQSDSPASFRRPSPSPNQNRFQLQAWIPLQPSTFRRGTFNQFRGALAVAFSLL